MIVRILGGGSSACDDLLGRLNQLDNTVATAVAADDDGAFSRRSPRSIGLSRARAPRYPTTELVTSDHVLPHADTTLEEAREAFAGEGAIPG